MLFPRDWKFKFWCSTRGLAQFLFWGSTHGLAWGIFLYQLLRRIFWDGCFWLRSRSLMNFVKNFPKPKTTPQSFFHPNCWDPLGSSLWWTRCWSQDRPWALFFRVFSMNWCALPKVPICSFCKIIRNRYFSSKILLDSIPEFNPPIILFFRWPMPFKNKGFGKVSVFAHVAFCKASFTFVLWNFAAAVLGRRVLLWS